jgi:hypothetical protein
LHFDIVKVFSAQVLHDPLAEVGSSLVRGLANLERKQAISLTIAFCGL